MPHAGPGHGAVGKRFGGLLIHAKYQDSRRCVQPLGLYFRGNVWTMAAWCELRNDFRSFRLDCMTGIAAGMPFEPKPGRRLHGFPERVRSELP